MYEEFAHLDFHELTVLASKTFYGFDEEFDKALKLTKVLQELQWRAENTFI